MVQGGCMKLTKYEHACFTLEKDGKLLVVDPGAFTTDLPMLENVVAVVVTHNHPDHFDPAALEALFASNPDIVVCSPKQVDDEIDAAFTHKAVKAGERIYIEPFSLEFFGEDHAVIHPSLPRTDNVGVMINDTLYYPGDSFIKPERPVEVLALPVGASWLKMSEVIDFAMDVKANVVFPTHDAVLSDIGKNLPDARIPGFVEGYGGTYQRLTNPLEI